MTVARVSFACERPPVVSVWVDYLRLGREGRAGELAELVEERQVVTCGPVVAELIAGTATGDRERLAQVLAGLPWVELGRPEWLRVGGLAADLRAASKTAPLTDEIAVAGLAAESDVWTADRDFERIAKVASTLEVGSL